MAKSIRISDELYELALREAALMERSLAQQVEHWVKLGVGMEHAKGAIVDDVSAGHKSAASLHAIPVALVKGARIDIPRDAFTTRRKGW